MIMTAIVQMSYLQCFQRQLVTLPKKLVTFPNLIAVCLSLSIACL
jgi:hypothetical protein